MGSLPDLLLQLSARVLLSTKPTQNPPHTHPFLGSKSPQNRLCPTSGSQRATVRAGRAIPLAPLPLPGISQAAASPGGASPSQPGRVPRSRRAQAEQEPGTGAVEELLCLSVQRDGFAEMGGLEQTTGSGTCKEIREGIYQAITTRSCEYSICDG